MTCAYSVFLVHGEKLQAPIPDMTIIHKISQTSRLRKTLIDIVSVAHVRPRTSKGITDLLLLNFVPLNVANPSKKSVHAIITWWLFSRLESRSLSELTRQITPPTKNGHAPPPTESRKSYQSVNPHSVRAGWVFPCWVKLSRRLHTWWCPSVNSFKFRICNHTPPRTDRLKGFPGTAGVKNNNKLRLSVGIVYGQN